MDGSGRFGDVQHFDRPLYLPPMAEVDDIAERAAVVRPLCSFGAGMLSKLRDQICRFGERSPVGHVNMVLQAFPALLLVPETRLIRCAAFRNRASASSTARSPQWLAKQRGRCH